MMPIPTEWWFRPVSSAGRVGAQSALVWTRLHRSPPAASRSAVGVWHGPPNALEAPKPTSSSKTTKTFGAPSGGSNGSIGGNAVSGSLASYVVKPGAARSGIGNVARAWRSGSLVMTVLHPWPAQGQGGHHPPEGASPKWGESSCRRAADAASPIAAHAGTQPGAIRDPSSHAALLLAGVRHRV